jgi:osmoprotectant transport system permease protein
MDWVLDHRMELVRLTLEHVVLSGTAIALALLAAVPLGVWIHGRPRRTGVVLGLAGMLYTLPSLAMLALLVPLLGLGAGPTVVALVVYAQLMLVRAVVAGLDSVPEDVRDAALGMGLDRRTILLRVDAPLALPVFLAGLRMAVVTVLGIATIGAVIDAGGLGELILQGIQRDHVERVVAGATAVTLLALAADFALSRAERLARPWLRSVG